jgi:enterobacterial common antigen flippase
LKTIFHSTLILSGSSIVNIFMGLITAKTFASLIGPDGLGYMGLLQGLSGLVAIVVGMGITTGIVRSGAQAIAQGNQDHFNALVTAGWVIVGVTSILAFVALAAFRVPIAAAMLGDSGYSRDVVLLGIALVIGLSASIQASQINAYQRVSWLARLSIANTIGSAGIGMLFVWQWGFRGIAPGMVVGSVMMLATSRFAIRRAISTHMAVAPRDQTIAAGRSLLQFGIPYTGSMLVGTGVQMILPVIVLHELSQTDVGYYRAALSISVNYLGFLLAAMGQDYYPRVSALSDKPSELVICANQQLRLILILATPLILGVLALAPHVVPIIYAPSFSPTVELLEWQLIGDIFKFSSWTMSFVILARNKGSTFFLTELIGGVVTLLSTWFSIKIWGFSGLGIGFLIGYAVYYLVVWLIVRRDVPLIWSRSNILLMLGALVAAASIRLLPETGLSDLRTPIAVAIAGAAGLASLVLLRIDLRRA